MKVYTIAIEETVVDAFEIEANNADEAMEIAEELYWKGKIVLEPGDVLFRQMAIIQPSDETTEWVEF
ncbi:MAG: hypothetical protein IJF50_04510 [Peptococcaceae bacterium]|nr:hypothetical protein [Peptococcaceae bacterium]MBR2009009.1 hypothetical protein [Peptococcaceae bacterium]